jgi:anti-anti-sigma regulatory factor
MTTLDDLHVLPADMRGASIGELFDSLRLYRGKSLVLDASAVERMDTLAAQFFVLLAKSWRTDEQTFKILNPSQKVTTSMVCLGLADFVDMESESDDN